MSNGSQIEQETRERILRLLSDDEIARASSAEATAAPLEGEEFLDLSDLSRGVRAAQNPTPGMSRLLLRRSVCQDTWNKILQQLRYHEGELGK
jgi:hypothetical protein